MNNKIRYLFKNIGLLTISQFSSKFLSFLLVPLYTGVLTAQQYGTYDVFHTTISLMIPILTVNIADAVLRFALDKNADGKQVLSVGMRLYGCGMFIFCILALINYKIGILPVLNEYVPYLLFLFAVTAGYELLVGYARGCDAVFDVAVAGIINSAAMMGLNIWFLLFLDWGLDGYFRANIIGTLCATVYLVIRLQVWKKSGNNGCDKELKRQMLLYGFPMMLTSISWWVNGFSSRYVILGFCGVAANGLYSVAYKIPSILSAFQEIFNKAWVLSSVSAFDKEDKSGFFTKTYSTYNCAMTLLCSGIILMARPIASVLFAKDFYEAWRYVPFLTVSVVFGALSGCLGGIFAAAKDTKAYAASTAVGAVVNLSMSIVLVPLDGPVGGPMGATVASLTAYALVWMIRLYLVGRQMKLRLCFGRDCVTYLLLVIQSIMLIYLPIQWGSYVLQGLCLVVIGGLYRREISSVLSVLRFRKSSGNG